MSASSDDGNVIKTTPDDWTDKPNQTGSGSGSSPVGRILLMILGILLVLIGIPLLILPGPGLLLIGIGIVCIVASRKMSKA